MRRLAIAAVGLLLAACGSQGSPRAASGPDPFLDGGRPAFEAFVKEQRGHPVVVNKWASWCGPCRAEFPFFRDLANKYKGKIVFVGVNSNDNNGDARDFLEDNPVPYKHFEDPKLEVAAAFNGVQAFPTTAFYDKQGELAFVHQGGYQSEDQLAEDIDRYAR
ncbi:MAG: TlpA family protein disulfide reductase [Thermoleophilaceae bacterium]|nr:TlpA family protein disulfide reductase [Thermoleophilaceae bacterium]